MFQTKTELTLEEFLSLPEGEGDITYELVDNQAVPKMSPKNFHSRLTRSLIKILEQWGEERGEIGVEWAVKFTRMGRDWVPVPDILYVSYERLSPDWNQDEACPVVPELVIEIISPEQTFGKLAAKARNYLDAKVLRVWVVDSKARNITVFYPDAAPQTYSGSQKDSRTLLGREPSEFSGYISCQSYLIFLRKAIYGRYSIKRSTF